MDVIKTDIVKKMKINNNLIIINYGSYKKENLAGIL